MLPSVGAVRYDAMRHHGRIRRLSDGRSGDVPMNTRQVLRALAIATSFGLTLALLTAAGVVGGRWLDGRAHTGPLFMILGLFVGLALGVGIFVREVGSLLGDSKRH